MNKHTHYIDGHASMLYFLHKKKKDPLFYQLKQKDRDYWRALALVTQEENSWPGLISIDTTNGRNGAQL